MRMASAAMDGRVPFRMHLYIRMHTRTCPNCRAAIAQFHILRGLSARMDQAWMTRHSAALASDTAERMQQAISQHGAAKRNPGREPFTTL